MNKVINGEVDIKKNDSKRIYLEVMRIIACFFVLFNHTGTYGFSLFSVVEFNSLKYWIYLFISIFSKFSVPLFFIISGALLLPKENESLKDLWKKRILKIISILVIWSFIYYLYEVFIGNERFNLINFFSKLYYDYWNFSYWYLYCYIAFLISLPFFRAMVNRLENKYFYYMFGIAIVTLAIIPILQYLVCADEYKMIGALNIGWLTTNFVLFPCIGYFLEYRVKINKKSIIAMWITNIITIGISCYMTFYKSKITGINGEDFHNIFVLINCVTIFITIKYIVNKMNLSLDAKKEIISLGSCTLGIYLIHLFFVRKFNFFIKIFVLLRNILQKEMIASFIFCVIMMYVCYIIILILKKVPIIKKIV